jgi:hypothetical protein
MSKNALFLCEKNVKSGLFMCFLPPFCVLFKCLVDGIPVPVTCLLVLIVVGPVFFIKKGVFFTDKRTFFKCKKLPKIVIIGKPGIRQKTLFLLIA